MSITSTVDPQQSKWTNKRVLTAAATLLLFAVFFAPFPLASLLPGVGFGNVGELSASMSSGFHSYWISGGIAFNTDLNSAVSFWEHFHAVKALLAGVLLFVLAQLAIQIYRSYVRASTTGARLRLAAIGMVIAGAAFLALLILTANIQGIIAPWTSAMGLLPSAPQTPELAHTLNEVSLTLETQPDATSLTALTDAFSRYHFSMILVGLATIVGLLAVIYFLWRSRSRMPKEQRRQRRVLSLSLLMVLTVIGFFALITAANISTVADPVPALIGTFNGSN
jgi:hypothetical protein